MLIMGLTGSIGMGKTTAANAFRRLGVPVYDSDAAVHKLLAADGEAVESVSAAFPGGISCGNSGCGFVSSLVGSSALVF